jgi:hypothetical protein
VPPLTDEKRAADESNPKGYYEEERVKKLRENNSWLRDCRGKVVKVVSPLLDAIPGDERYKVVFVRRRMPEILASQRAMMERMGSKDSGVDDSQMATFFQKHLADIQKWIDERDNVDAVYLDFHEVVADPMEAAAKVRDFLELDAPAEKMAGVVEPKLYRERVTE